MDRLIFKKETQKLFQRIRKEFQELGDRIPEPSTSTDGFIFSHTEQSAKVSWIYSYSYYVGNPKEFKERFMVGMDGIPVYILQTENKITRLFKGQKVESD